VKKGRLSNLKIRVGISDGKVVLMLQATQTIPKE
jgi:hypothetical protein